jgi:hypothetical protein
MGSLAQVGLAAVAKRRFAKSIDCGIIKMLRAVSSVG